ncbi:MAG: acetylornithine deacetylase [Saonia sp.]
MMENPEKHIDSAISILSDLVAFPVLGGHSNLSIAAYIMKVLEDNHIEYHKVVNTSGDKVAIHCRIGPSVDGGLILSGHMDVVPTKGQTWTRPDFKMTRDGEKLYGRGTTDMKGFLACCLAMLPYFKGSLLKKPIYLAFSYDEEVGCLAGPSLITAIKSTYSEQPHYAIVGEPSSMKMIIGGKGVAFFKTKIYCSPAHSSEVRKSVSAIEEATYLIQWLLGRMDKFTEELCFDKRFEPPYTTIHIGTIKGGVAANIIADYCEFEWDVRNIPLDSIEKILDSFKSFCEQQMVKKQKVSNNFKISTSAQFPIVPSLDTPENSEVVELVNSLNGNESTGTVSFASEAGQFSEAGFHTVICGPGNMEQGHGVDEYMETGELKKCLSFLGKLADWSKN